MVQIPLHIVLAHPRRELLNSAFHEAAHAIVACRLGLDVIGASIDQDGGGITTTSRDRGPFMGPPAWTVQSAAGPKCSAMLGFDLEGCRQDLLDCHGTPPDQWEDAVSRAAELIERHWADICVVAETLLQRGKLTGAELHALLHKEQ